MSTGERGATREMPLDPSTTREPCPHCGARVGGRAGCQALFSELGARAWESPQRASVHNLVVDSYCMQHPEEYGRSAKSYMAHLAGLCCGVEFGSEPALYWKIARSLDGQVPVEKPPLISFRGTCTVSDAFSVGTTEEYVERVRAWSLDVWAAYQPQQQLAREWLRTLQDRGTTHTERKP